MLVLLIILAIIGILILTCLLYYLWLVFIEFLTYKYVYFLVDEIIKIHNKFLKKNLCNLGFSTYRLAKPKKELKQSDTINRNLHNRVWSICRDKGFIPISLFIVWLPRRVQPFDSNNYYVYSGCYNTNIGHFLTENKFLHKNKWLRPFIPLCRIMNFESKNIDNSTALHSYEFFMDRLKQKKYHIKNMELKLKFNIYLNMFIWYSQKIFIILHKNNKKS